MRWRVIALVSLGVNMLLAAAWLVVSREKAAKVAAAAAVAPGQTPSAQTRTNVILRRQLFSWRDIESADYAVYIANLRDIGCPEQTVRDIIIADVNAVYARKRATELVTAEQQWWRSEPDTNVLRAAAQQAQELEDERRTLLTSLLGGSWEAGDLVSIPRPSRPGVALDGPVLGSLPAETKKSIQEVNARSQERLEAYLEAQSLAGKNPDPIELAKLRQQTRNDLAHLLSPPELEEYLLRYSQNANDLRAQFGQLRFFNPSPDEFRAVFRATDALDQRIQLLADARDPSSIAARKALEDQRENAVKVALGSKRYEEYRLMHDPLYQEKLEEAGGDSDTARTLYATYLAAFQAAQTNRLTADQQKALEDQLVPPDLPPLPPTPQPRRVYVLGPGDSAATIALMYGLPESAIRAANPKVDFNRLKPGVAITIPRSPLFPESSP